MLAGWRCQDLPGLRESFDFAWSQWGKVPITSRGVFINSYVSLCRHDWFHSFIKIFSVDDIQQAVSNFPLVLFHIKIVTKESGEMDQFLLHLLLFLSTWVWLLAPTWYFINIQFQGIQPTLLVLVSTKHTCYTQTCAGNLTRLRVSSMGKLGYWPPILISFSILLFVLLG